MTLQENTANVVNSHLAAFAEGLDALVADYDESSVIITPRKVFRGLDQVRSFFDTFLREIPEGFWDAFKLNSRVEDRQFALLVWEAKPWVLYATDSLYIADSKIKVQTFASLSSNA
jgi:hypothetical protein